MQHKINLILIAAILICQTTIAFAQVNLQEGSFNWSQTELLIASPTERLSWSRSYGSRSEYRGLMGLGWCTEFEWTLATEGPFYWLKKCDEAERLAQSRVRVSTKTIEVRVGGHWLVFAKTGELIGLRIRRGKPWLLQRDLMRHPSGLLSPGGLMTHFLYDFNGGLKKISAPESHWLFATDAGLLRSLQAFPGAKETYTYDAFANLTLVRRNGRRLVQATYDDAKDIVTEVRDETCRSQFGYQTQSGADFVDDQVLETRTCTGRSPRITENRFRYRKLPQNQIVLERRSARLQGDE